MLVKSSALLGCQRLDKEYWATLVLDAVEAHEEEVRSAVMLRPPLSYDKHALPARQPCGPVLPTLLQQMLTRAGDQNWCPADFSHPHPSASFQAACLRANPK